MDIEDEAHFEKELGVGRKGLSRIVIGIGILGFLGIGLAGWENYGNQEETSRRKKIESVLESRTWSIPTKVIKGDTLQIYAVKVQEQNRDCLEGISTKEIEDYIRKINPGAKDSKLIPEMQILLPSYNVGTCKKLSDFYPVQR